MLSPAATSSGGGDGGGVDSSAGGAHDEAGDRSDLHAYGSTPAPPSSPVLNASSVEAIAPWRLAPGSWPLAPDPCDGSKSADPLREIDQAGVLLCRRPAGCLMARAVPTSPLSCQPAGSTVSPPPLA